MGWACRTGDDELQSERYRLRTDIKGGTIQVFKPYSGLVSEANHSSLSYSSAPPTCIFGVQDPGPNPRGPRAASMRCIIASTFSSSHGRPTTCTPTGRPSIADGS